MGAMILWLIGSTGGAYFTEWNPLPDEWLPGVYTVQLFVGEEYVGSSRFLVQGEPPTSLPTATPTRTGTPTLASSRTPMPSATPTPTEETAS